MTGAEPLLRLSINVPVPRAERVRALMLELFPSGFEEVELADGSVELAAYAPPGAEERFWSAFGPGQTREVEAGWERGWRRFHRPVRVGPLWLGPPWLEPDADALPVVIDPGRAFGTGAHATTRLCLELLLGCERGSLADFGSGSGVLAIAAAKLGFEPVSAFDVDDVAVANIALRAVEEMAPRARARRLITSGYLASERPVVAGWEHVERREAESWGADLYERIET